MVENPTLKAAYNLAPLHQNKPLRWDYEVRSLYYFYVYEIDMSFQIIKYTICTSIGFNTGSFTSFLFLRLYFLLNVKSFSEISYFLMTKNVSFYGYIIRSKFSSFSMFVKPG